jgi:hypothetical protein
MLLHITEYATLIKDEHVGFGQRRHQLGITPIAFGNGKFLQESGQPEVEGRIAFTTGLVPQGTGNPRFIPTR